MTEWLYKWLPIFFGCHCRPDRSFHWKGKQFPLCARCTGEAVGILVGLVGIFFRQPPVWLCVLLMIPMVTDGLIQLKTRYESNNIKRVITGFFFGYALFSLFAMMNIASFRFGYRMAVGGA